VRLVAEHRHHHHVGVGPGAGDLADQVDAVAVRQAEVDQRDVERAAGDRLAGALGVADLGGQHHGVVARDGGADGLAEGVVIVHDQDSGRGLEGHFNGFGHCFIGAAQGRL